MPHWICWKNAISTYSNNVMKHLGTKTLETSRLLLRRLCIDDAQAMYHNWASDDQVTKYLTWPSHTSPAITSAVLQSWVELYAEPDYYHWAIVLKACGDQPIGSIAVVSLEDSVKKAQIGYCIGQAWWHKGIMTEALNAVIHFMISEVGMNRVEAYHDTRNPHSGAVMRKCGMQYEGTLRASAWNNQGVCDASWYAILSE